MILQDLSVIGIAFGVISSTVHGHILLPSSSNWFSVN